MKKITILLSICSLLAYNTYNFAMQDEIDIEADNSTIAQEIQYALEILSPTRNETIEQRYTELVDAYKESPYSIVTSLQQIKSPELQAEQELQEIQYAFHIMQQYNLIHKTLPDIEARITPFIPKQESLTKNQALNILDLQDDSWTSIEEEYMNLEMQYHTYKLTEEQIDKIRQAYDYLLSTANTSNQSQKLTEQEVLAILGLPENSSWAKIKNKFESYKEMYEDEEDEFNDDDYGEMLKAYNILSEQYDKK